MTINEIYDKYLSDDSIKKEIKELLENNDFDTVIRKYSLSCTKEELANFISEKTESSNCKDDEKEFRIKQLERKMEQTHDLIKALHTALRIACKNEDQDEIKRITNQIHENEQRMRDLQAEIDRLRS